MIILCFFHAKQMDDKLLEMIKDCIRKDNMHPFYVNGKWKKKDLK